MLDIRGLTQISDIRELGDKYLVKDYLGIRLYQTIDIWSTPTSPDESPVLLYPEGWYEIVESEDSTEDLFKAEFKHIPYAVEQVDDLKNSTIVPSKENLNKRVYCTKSEPSKKYAPGWYEVGEDDLTPIVWSNVMNVPYYENISQNNVLAVGYNTGDKVTNLLGEFYTYHEPDTNPAVIYILTTGTIVGVEIPHISGTVDLKKNVIYRYRCGNATPLFEPAQINDLFKSGVADKVYNYPVFDTPTKCFINGSNLVVKNDMVGKYICLIETPYVRPAILPAYYQVLETYPNTYKWLECNDTWETDDIRKFNWMLNLDWEGYQVFQFKNITEGEPSDANYYYKPRGTYVVTDHDGTYQWNQLKDANMDLEFPDIDDPSVTEIYLREDFVGYRIFQTTDTFEIIPSTGEKEVKRSKGWYDIVVDYPHFPDTSVKDYIYKTATGERGYVTAIDFTKIRPGTGWRIVRHSCWENDNMAFIRIELLKISDTPSNKLVQKLPTSVNSEQFIVDGDYDTSNPKRVPLGLSLTGTISYIGDVLNAPNTLLIDLWYVVGEEQKQPLLATLYGIDSASMTSFKQALKDAANTTPYKISFHRA